MLRGMPPQQPVPEALRKRPFTRAEAVAAGLSPRMLRGSRFRRLFRGVYVCADAGDGPLLRLDAALLVLPPKAAASHLSAAVAFGLPVPVFAEVHAVVRRGWLESRIEGICVHEARPARDIIEHRGYRVTSPTRTFVDLADLLGLPDLVVVGDAMVRLGLCTPTQLVEEAAAARTRRVRLARRAAALVRPRVDSPMETRVRLLLVLAGLPEPQPNLDVLSEDGRWLFRPDLSYPELRIAIEYDGRHHDEDAGQWEHDIGRMETYERHGWRVIVVTAKRFYGQPGATIRRVLDALRERDHAGAPATISDEWVQHFGR
jgi:hypothetical protein